MTECVVGKGTLSPCEWRAVAVVFSDSHPEHTYLVCKQHMLEAEERGLISKSLSTLQPY